MNINEAVQALEAGGYQPKRLRPNQWESRCPAHDDQKPSLHISQGDNDLLMHCKAGCTFSDICSALSSADVSSSNAGIQKPATEPPAPEFPTLEEAVGIGAQKTWIYTDAGGKPVGAVARSDSSSGKNIWQASRKANGNWHRKAMPAPRPLYRLLALVQAETVYICEGEKAADAAAAMGLEPATTSAGGSNGAAKTDWQPLAGKKVVLFPDNDDAGRKYAEKVRKLVLQHGAAEARVLHLDELLPDWTAGKGADLADVPAELQEQLVQQVHQVLQRPAVVKDPPCRLPVLRCMADVEPEALEWLWPGRFPMGKFSIIAGDPGTGKSMTTIDMVARVSTGRAWPDLPNDPTAVRTSIMMNMEDDAADTIRPRLDAAGADVRRVHIMDGQRARDGRESTYSLADGIETLEYAIRETGAELVTIDPLSAYLGAKDSHKDADVRAILGPLSMLAAKTGTAVVAVSHLNKGQGSNVLYRTMGSLATVAAARSQWLVVKDKDDANRRLFLEGKNNLGPNGTGLAYSVAPGDNGHGRVVWESGPVDISAAEAMTNDRPTDSDAEDRREWLREKLGLHSVSASEIYHQAEAFGWSQRSLQRSLKDVGGSSFKSGSTYMWTLSKTCKVQVDSQVDTL
jgi:hypothetical protein